jgi:hypothetical protein
MKAEAEPGADQERAAPSPWPKEEVQDNNEDAIK